MNFNNNEMKMKNQVNYNNHWCEKEKDMKVLPVIIPVEPPYGAGIIEP